MQTKDIFMKTMPMWAMLAFVSAETSRCDINFNGGGGDDCVNLADTCPNLACEDGYAVGDDGCTICECRPAATCIEEGCPDGEQCIVDRDGVARCEFNGGGGLCDAVLCPDDSYCDDSFGFAECIPYQTGDLCEGIDCGPGAYCVVERIAIDDVGNVEEYATCVYDQAGCFSDDECAPGEKCVIGQGDPRAEDQAIAVQPGYCAPIDIGCFSDDECGEGFYCSFEAFGEGSNGMESPDAAPVAPVGFCAPRNFDGCGQCPDGTVCQETVYYCDGSCLPDPDSEGCLPCEPFVAYECVAATDPCDGACTDGTVCEEVKYDVCTQECIEDPSNPMGCLPCEPFIAHECVAITDECGGCGPNQYCEVSSDGCGMEDPCVYDENGEVVECRPCDPVLTAQCVDIGIDVRLDCAVDADCGEGTICSTSFGDCQFKGCNAPDGADCAAPTECLGFCISP
jgi:hypothetical protein